tara:strand:+ start:222 stop:1427 length:1206 start_codon:yes stop_codon:yes gene_type:complete
MKWIGQHIWDFISRFRGDVYLENVSDHGSDPDRFLTMDSTTGKVTYRTGSEVASDIGAASLTQEQVEDYAGALVATGGTKTGISVTYQDGTGDMDFEVDHDAATNFVAAEHYRWDNDISGTATINANNIPTLNQNTTGSAATLTTTRAFQTDLASTSSVNFNGSAANTHGVTGTLAISNGGTGQTSAANAFGALKQAATSSATGVVELATTGEADTGTDTSRAVTCAGLKSHVDGRYHYQYISFLSNMTTASNWGTVSNNGISNHSWNQSLGTNGTTVGSSTGTVPVATIVSGIVVPYDCTLVGFKAVGMGGSNHQYELGLMVGVPTFNDYATFDCTLRAYKAAVSGSPDNSYASRAIAIEDLTRSYSITAGHMIYPCVKSASGSGTNKVSWTIVLKTLIP